MGKEELYKLLKSDYKTERWKEIVSAIFPSRDFFAFEEPISLDTQYQKNGAQKIVKFGNITLDDGTSLALYEVEIKPGKKIAKNRVELRGLLSSQILPGIVDGALISYFEKGQTDWRFTFISKSYYWDEQGNSVKKETHPKRYTYVLGKDETCITPRERFWYLIEKKKKTIKDVLEAFSVEKVSKDFFTKYKKNYQNFVDAIVSSPFRKTIFHNEDEKPIRDFVKKMMGRIVFLLFIQKKGWLDVAKGKNYGEGNKRFLQELFNAHNDSTFYATCLVPLFFDALNNPKNDVYIVTGNRIPFLNGGLFERDEIETKKGADFITFDPILFESLFSFLDEYNFTIDESSPDDQDIGIDPEMLGHIFENLLEDNWEKGAFYTPKIIVQYMCQEALIQYLESHLGERNEIKEFIRYKKRGDENAKKNFIRDKANEINQLLDDVRICDPAIGSGAFPMGILHEIFQAKLVLNWTLIKDKAAIKRNIIQNSIYGVDKDKGAVDIARLRFWLSLIVDEEVEPGGKPEPLPSFDYKIMQGDSLFESYKGCSLKYHEVQQVLTQKNLFETDNSLNLFGKTHKDLAKLEKEYYHPDNHGRKIEIRNEIDELVTYSIESSFKDKIKELKFTIRAIKAKSSSSTSIEKKKGQDIAKLEAEIAEMETGLADVKKLMKKDEKPWFLWHLYFKDVLGDKKNPGFDIVIGNPPYIRQELITDIKPYLETEDGRPNYKVYNSVSDIYTYFFELGHRILKKNKGIFTFICSKQYTKGRFGQKLRKFILDNVQITGYIDFDEVQVFGATVDTSIIFFSTDQNRKPDYEFTYCTVGNDIQLNDPLIEYINQKGIDFQKEYLSEDNWSFANPRDQKIIALITVNKRLVSHGVKINLGIKTGFNEAYYIDGEKAEEFIKDDSQNAKIIEPLIRGRNIKKYKISFNNTYLLNVHNGYKKIPRIEVKKEHPIIYKHLLEYKKDLQKRGDQGADWTNLRNCAYIDDFKKDKIIWLTLSDKANFAFDNEGYFVNNSSYFFCGSNLKYFVSVLNSKVVEWYFNHFATHSGVGTNRWEKTYVEQIPIPEIPEIEMRPFEVLVDYITFIKKTELRISQYATNEHMATNFEEMIDACVYELYFKDHMRECGLLVLEDVKKLLEPIDELTDEQEIVLTINAVYDKYKESDNPIRKKIMNFPAKSPEIINVIQNG